MSDNRPLASKTPWEALYDFLDDIFATMIPGCFFLSFFFCILLALMEDLSVITSFAANMSLVTIILVGSVAYCFGALFQRREIKKIDTASARHIYRKMPHTSGHSFGFANALTDAYVIRLTRILQFHAIILNKQENQEFFAALSEAASKALNKTCGSIGVKYRFSGGKLQPFIAKMLLYQRDMPDASENPRALASNQDLNDKLTEIDVALRAKSYPPLKELVECEVWSAIESKYAELDSKTLDAGEAFCQLLNCRHLRPFLLAQAEEKQSAGSGFARIAIKLRIVRPKNNLTVIKGFLKALNRAVKEHRGEEETCAVLKQILDYVNSDLNGSIDWPYTHMRRYCSQRGLEYSDLVDWGDGAVQVGVLDEIGLTTDSRVSDEINRSKSRINTRKMRIEQENPVLYKSISKNEAHIRFMNSIWYATRIIQIVAIVTAALCLAILTAYIFTNQNSANGVFPLPLRNNVVLNISVQRVLYAFALSSVYALGCVYIRHSVKEILHYQRVRELNMILEALKITGEQKAAGC